MPFDSSAPAPLPAHVQALEADYRDRLALHAEAGFSPDLMVSPKDLLGASFARIDSAFARAAPNAKPFAGFYPKGIGLMASSDQDRVVIPGQEQPASGVREPAKAKLRTFGWDSCKLADGHSLEGLYELRVAIESDPANADPQHGKGGLYLYAKPARRKLDALAWAVTHKLAARPRCQTCADWTPPKFGEDGGECWSMDRLDGDRTKGPAGYPAAHQTCEAHVAKTVQS